MALFSDPSVYGAIWNAKFNRQSRIDYVGDKFINARRELGTKNVILGLRNGIPDNQDQDINFKRAQQLKPYVNSMNPYKTNLMVDIVPSVYNTNPMAGMGGYEANLASFNGTRPLATALDEPKEVIERLYEDKFRLSPSHPLSAQYSMNQKRLDKTVRGTMYDAFRSRMNDNTTEEDLVMESKIMKGYGNNAAYGKTSTDRLTSEVVEYMKKQRPINATDLMTNQKYEDLFTRHLNPAPLNNITNQLNAVNAQLGDTNLNLGRVHGAVGNSSRYLVNAMDAAEIRRDRDYAQIHQQMRDSNQNLININNNVNQLNTTIEDSNLGQPAPYRRVPGIPLVPNNRAPFTPGSIDPAERERRRIYDRDAAAEANRIRRRRSSGMTDLGSPGT